MQIVPSVKTLEEARDPKTLEWCVQRIVDGASLDTVRKELGLGLASVDKRWRSIRKELISQSLPSTDEEAFVRMFTAQEELIQKIEGYIEELEKVMADNYESKHDALMWGNRLKALQVVLQARQEEFDRYLDTKKAKGLNKGLNIIFQTNIPRPKKLQKAEQELKDVIDVGNNNK